MIIDYQEQIFVNVTTEICGITVGVELMGARMGYSQSLHFLETLLFGSLPHDKAVQEAFTHY